MATIDLPDTAVEGELDHIIDHNKIVAAIGTINSAVETVETELGSNPSGTYSTVADRLADLKSSALYTPPGTPTFADEFSGPSMNGAWSRIDAAGAATHLTFTQADDALTFSHNTATDGPGVHHLLLQPVGTAFAPGDALVTAYSMGVQGWAVNNIMAGVVLTNGTVHGTSNGIHAQTYTNSSSGSFGMFVVRKNNGFTADSGEGGNPRQVVVLGGPIYIRLVMTAANTWRQDWSINGYNWNIATATTAYTLTPTHMGLSTSLWASTTPFFIRFEFFRRYSGVA